MDDRAGEHRADWVQPVLEGGDDAEVSAPAPQAPEQIRVLLGAGGQEPPISRDDVGGEQVVAGQPVLALQPADSTAEREPGDPGGRDRATGGGQPEGLGLPVELTPGQAGLGLGAAPGRVDPHALHRRQIDDYAVVAYRFPRDVVPAAPDRDGQVLLDAELQRCQHIGDPRAAGDHRRPLIDHPVVHPAGDVVARVFPTDHQAAQRRPQCLKSTLVKPGRHVTLPIVIDHHLCVRRVKARRPSGYLPLVSAASRGDGRLGHCTVRSVS